ncbi:hypothetical protein K2173_004262 [Erythroxylum novogranatense]|uniref:RanBD1 domain-containing protein n=1 Tax=Erythroxylum novogranatense TaxID=1862640 RepID=A0AAV8U2C4_9ROSI|nr:hypothetical protein K2173_004262 [Erythroxylum novogranatense]
MGDAENSLPPSKKRVAGREISKENPALADDEDSIEQETGTFKKASDQVLASRRIVKFCRSRPSSPPAVNPFAGIHLVPPSIPAAPTADDTIGKIVTGGEGLSEDTKKDPSEEVEKDGGENPSLSEPSEPTASSVPNASEVVEKVEGENIKFLESESDESLAESATHTLNIENGADKGDEAAETKVENMKQPGDKISTTVIERARLLMRCSGNYRLILNAGLYPEMKLTDMDKQGVTFACMNSTAENKDSLSTYALKFKDGSIVKKFRAAITAHKGEAVIVLKTPENSPKASEN